MSDLLKNMQDKLHKLASQEYIEMKFREMITKSILSQKLDDLKHSIKTDFRKEISSVREEVKVLVTRVSIMESTVEEMKNQISDLERKSEGAHAENARGAIT